jgi:2-hydroxychromene-2-carboxylate isomerase
VILEYGDYECPYARAAYREIQRVEQLLGVGVRFGFRHFPLTQIHPHALAAAATAETAALQHGFWEEMHNLLFHHQTALEGDDLRRYAAKLELDLTQFDRDRTGSEVMRRIGRDVESGLGIGRGERYSYIVHRRCGAPGVRTIPTLASRVGRMRIAGPRYVATIWVEA